jgi:carboxyl-terminal processing protease
VRVSSFGPGAAEALRGAVNAAGPSAANGVIIDLRDVADGAPEEGIAAARLFVKTGTIAIRAGRPTPTPARSASAGSGSTSVVAPPPQTVRPTIPDTAVKTVAGPGDGALAMPVVLLVSNGTAHAAEIFAAALSNNKRAVLVGEPTAGLAGVQRLVRLPEGHGLMLTTERYLQTDGVPIHSRGLRPNVLVEIPTIGFDEQKPTTDPVLERGVKELTSPTPAAAVQPQATSSNPASAAPPAEPNAVRPAPDRR